MSLPSVPKDRLQRVVSMTEFKGDYTVFGDLCSAVAKDGWAKSNNLDADTIGKLIVEHDISVCVEDKPEKPKSEKPVADAPADKGPGKGRKACPKCGTYVGLRTQLCPKCEHEFVAGAAERAKCKPAPKEVEQKPGKGRKQCPSCKLFVGLRTQNCPKCQHEFVSKAASSPAPTSSTTPTASRTTNEQAPAPVTPRYSTGGRGGMPVIAPAGKPAILLKSDDTDAVHEWAEAIRDHYAPQGRFMTLNALCYWAHYGHDKSNLDRAKVIRTLKELYPEEAKQTWV